MLVPPSNLSIPTKLTFKTSCSLGADSRGRKLNRLFKPGQAQWHHKPPGTLILLSLAVRTVLIGRSFLSPCCLHPSGSTIRQHSSTKRHIDTNRQWRCLPAKTLSSRLSAGSHCVVGCTRPKSMDLPSFFLLEYVSHHIYTLAGFLI